jgi:hypothetical protein
MVNRAMHGEELFAFTSGFGHEIDGKVAGRGPKPASAKRNDVFLINRIKNGQEGAIPRSAVHSKAGRSRRSSPTSTA